jgi:hypothetical protein
MSLRTGRLEPQVVLWFDMIRGGSAPHNIAPNTWTHSDYITR